MRIFDHLLFLEDLTKKNHQIDFSNTNKKNSNTSSKFVIVLEFLQKIEV